MFAVLQEKASPPVLLLDTNNSSKGGDFMGIEQCLERQADIAAAIRKMMASRMEWEGGPVPSIKDPVDTTNPEEVVVPAVTQDQVLKVENSSFPEVRDRTRFDQAPRELQ